MSFFQEIHFYTKNPAKDLVFQLWPEKNQRDVHEDLIYSCNMFFFVILDNFVTKSFKMLCL